MRRRLPRTGTALSLGIVLVAGGVLFSKTRHYGLLGWDAYPIILTSRIGSWADVLGNFNERLMDGRYPGRFYRPLVNWTFALDHSVWNLDPFGYQLTNVVLFCLCALALYALVRRLAGSGARLASLVSLLVFLVHPAHFEVIPVPPRRPELLCCLFMLLALFLQLSPGALRARRPPLWPAVATLLAIASKETGFVLPVLAFGAVWLYSPRQGWLERARHAAMAIVPQLIAAASMLVVRLAVLGGVGGHRPLPTEDLVQRAPAYLWTLLIGLVFPQPAMLASGTASLLSLLLLAGLAASAAARVLDRQAGREERNSDTTLMRGAIVALLWVLVLGWLYVAPGWIRAWYYLLPAAGWAMGAGILFQALVLQARSGERASRWAAMVSVSLLTLLLVWQARFSPLVRNYDEWERATAASRVFLEQTRERIATASGGSVVEAPPLPFWVQPKTDGPTILEATVLADYSVQAWSELALPDRKVTVRYLSQDHAQPKSDTVVLLIDRRLEGF